MNWSLIISGSLFFLGLIFFIYFSTRKNYYHKPTEPIEDYKEVRTKVTLRKKEKEVKDISYSLLDSFPNIITGVITTSIVLIVMIYIFGTISSTLQIDSASYNVTNIVAQNINKTADYLPVIFVIGFAVLMICIISMWWRRSDDFLG